MGQWQQIQAQTDASPTAAGCPCGRDIWGNSFFFDGDLYIFGGAWERYGNSTRWREHGCLGTGNDLWRFSLKQNKWSLLQADDWSIEYGERAKRPGARMLASFSVVGEHTYLFGGLAVLESSFVLRSLNDFWQYHIPTRQWNMIHPDTGWCNYINRPSHPSIRGAHRTAVVGKYIYLFGGWPGTAPVFTINDFWRYDTESGQWDQLSPWRSRQQGSGYSADSVYPGPRYCFNLFAHNGALYLFSGRDTGERTPEFFNDLWRYQPDTDQWSLLYPNDGLAEFSQKMRVPAARYGSGHTVLDDYLYLFGGHNGAHTRVERNDFWRYHVPTNQWEQLYYDDGLARFESGATHPGARRVPVLESAGRSLLLFGGLNCFMGPEEAGYSLPLNDLWRWVLD